MKPFQEFRLWASSGPSAERVVFAVAASLVLVMLVWVGIPTGNGSSPDALAADLQSGGGGEQVAAGGPGAVGSAADPGAALTGTDAGGPAAPGAGPGSVSGAGSTGAGVSGAPGAAVTGPGAVSGPAGAAPGARPGRTCLAGSRSEGVTDKEILVGVVLVDIGALNSAIGIPTQEEHRKAYKTVLDDINGRGGAQCRKIVPKYYVENVTDPSTAQAACLQMQEDKVYAVLNNLHNPQAITCVAQAKIPNIWYTPPHDPTLEKYSPYVMSFMPDYSRLVKNYVRGLNAVGWFAGRKKVGILQGSCYPYLNDAIRRELGGIGIAADQLQSYDYGCATTSLAAPEKDTAAAVQFQREGVTHVLSVQYLQSPNFAKAAEQQQYRPQYAVMSDGQVSASDKSATPPPESFDGALAIAMDSIGAQHTAGIALSAATERCRKLIKGAGLKDPVGPDSGVAGGLYGVACTNTSMLAEALARVPSLTRAGLALGLAKVGPMDLSFPAGPSVFDNPRNPTGGQSWRVVAFEYDCNCWRVSSPAWRKQFA